MSCYRRIYGADQSQAGRLYIHRFEAQTDEYIQITFIGPETDECNLNIFVSTDEFKTTDE
jgi:hypothetical protein